MSDFIIDADNADVLKAKILIMEVLIGNSYLYLLIASFTY